jgi:hypothetical protein
LAAAEQALATASGDRSYYIKQAKKFRRLAEEQGSEI